MTLTQSACSFSSAYPALFGCADSFDSDCSVGLVGGCFGPYALDGLGQEGAGVVPLPMHLFVCRREVANEASPHEPPLPIIMCCLHRGPRPGTNSIAHSIHHHSHPVFVPTCTPSPLLWRYPKGKRESPSIMKPSHRTIAPMPSTTIMHGPHSPGYFSPFPCHAFSLFEAPFSTHVR